MFKELNENKVYKILLGIILVLTIILLIGQIDYFVKPLMQILSILVLPILIGGYLYYLFRPMVQFLTERIGYKSVSVLITLVGMITLLVGVTYFGGNMIKEETQKMFEQFSAYLPADTSAQEMIPMEDGNFLFLDEFDIQKRMISFSENLIQIIRGNIAVFFSSVTNIGTILVLIPLVLFFLLKDDKFFYEQFVKWIPEEEKGRTMATLAKIDETLVTYIGGQVIVALILGGLTLVGYLLIGLRSALILAIISMVLTFIPFVGPILGALPAIFIGLSEGMWMVVKILIVLVVVQQLEGNLVRPIIQGDRLHIHPLLVVFLVLIFIILFGFLGALFAVPCYAVLRVLAQEYVGRDGVAE